MNATFRREALQGRKTRPSEREAHLDAFRWLHRYNTDAVTPASDTAERSPTKPHPEQHQLR
ncbi:hypothetical protein [Streptomyces sp. NPDC047841]|uniref:hypothetical protein n=1 Tax=Streptomyces sp. NPDC047841 TaxID=3154708 RepID=UPI0034542768